MPILPKYYSKIQDELLLFIKWLEDNNHISQSQAHKLIEHQFNYLTARSKEEA